MCTILEHSFQILVTKDFLVDICATEVQLLHHEPFHGVRDL